MRFGRSTTLPLGNAAGVRFSFVCFQGRCVTACGPNRLTKDSGICRRAGLQLFRAEGLLVAFRAVWEKGPFAECFDAVGKRFRNPSVSQSLSNLVAELQALPLGDVQLWQLTAGTLVKAGPLTSLGDVHEGS